MTAFSLASVVDLERDGRHDHPCHRVSVDQVHEAADLQPLHKHLVANATCVYRITSLKVRRSAPPNAGNAVREPVGNMCPESRWGDKRPFDAERVERRPVDEKALERPSVGTQPPNALLNRVL
jgi:hypothetical protein